MSNRFLTSQTSNVSDGSTDIFGSSLGAVDLTPGLPVKVTASQRLDSTLLSISDTSGLQAALNAGISNPLTTDLNADQNKITDVNEITLKTGANTATVQYNGTSDQTVDLNDMFLADGSVPLTGTLSLADTGLNFASDTDTKVYLGGTNIISFDTSGINRADITDSGLTATNLTATTAVITDSITEKTADNGVQIDGLIIKDNDLDMPSNAVMDIGTISATTVNVGRTGQVVNMPGSLTVPRVDTATGVALEIGDTTATSIELGKSGIDTHVVGSGHLTFGVQPNYLYAPNATQLCVEKSGLVWMCFDSANNRINVGAPLDSSGALSLGTSTSTSVDISRTGITTNILGDLAIDEGLSTTTLDTATTVALNIGPTNSSQVNISQAGRLTAVLGPMSILAGTFANPSLYFPRGSNCEEVEVLYFYICC